MSVSTKPPSDEAVVLSAPAAVSCSPQVGPWILAATILASSMVFIDGTVVNIALPALQASFGASVSYAQWVLESFALLLGALLLAGGAAGDHFGRRRVFAIGVVLFTAASLWCGLAASVQGTDRRACCARCRRRTAGAGQPRHHQRVVRRARARQGHRHLVGLQRHDGSARAGARRLPHRSFLLALRVSHQRSAGTRRSRAHLLARAGKQRHRHRGGSGLGRRTARDTGPGRHGVCAHRIFQ